MHPQKKNDNLILVSDTKPTPKKYYCQEKNNFNKLIANIKLTITRIILYIFKGIFKIEN